VYLVCLIPIDIYMRLLYLFRTTWVHDYLNEQQRVTLLRSAYEEGTWLIYEAFPWPPVPPKSLLDNEKTLLWKQDAAKRSSSISSSSISSLNAAEEASSC
jgi:hypothetical protein